MKQTFAASEELTSAALASSHCQPMRGQAPMSPRDVERHLAVLSGWSAEGGALSRRFVFDDFTQTLLFVSAVGWMALGQDHHPELRLDSSTCTVLWTTHDVDGLSRNDFICAARTDALR